MPMGVYIRSKESRENMSKALMGNKNAHGNKGKKGQIPWNKGKLGKSWNKGLKFGPHSQEHKNKISLSNRGRKLSDGFKQNLKIKVMGLNNPNWKGGVTPENLKIRNSTEYAFWRETVFKRDRYTCVWCGIRGGTWDKINKRTIKINADHIKPFCIFLDLRLKIDNGRTLCEDCHRITDTFGVNARKLSPTFSKEEKVL